MLLPEDLSIIDLPNFVKRCYYVTIPFIILRTSVRKPRNSLLSDPLLIGGVRGGTWSINRTPFRESETYYQPKPDCSFSIHRARGATNAQL